ncbi:MAG: hypothetical protein DWQ08_13255 [Proteobacteria bacterium]|nr:MAG: hypothetical protein DWQ08_13255 [Pseudomonadota bacterium]
MSVAAVQAFGQKEVLTKKEYKPYISRTNRHGLVRFAIHGGSLIASGIAVHASLGTWWVVPSMACHAVLMAFLFAPVHECSHRTAFRNRTLNEAVYWIVCLLYMVPPTFFRYAHATHHTYTQVRGWDPDMLPENMTMRDYVLFVLGATFWRRNFQWLLRHPFGKIDPKQRYYLPDSEIPRVVREARLIMLIYSGVAAVAVFYGSWAPMVYWIVPRLVGEPFMRWLRVSEHGDCEESPDLRRNTRTTLTNRLIRCFFWEMPYHAEHHLCPLVPFHALNRLHDKIGDRLHPVGDGYLAVNRQVVGNIRSHRPEPAMGADGSQRPVEQRRA